MGQARDKKLEQEKHTAEVMYESEGKTPNGIPFMTVKQARGYYCYSERGGVDGIAFILFNNDTKKFALIYESKPPMDERENKEVRMCTAFGGSIDVDGMTPKEICQMEVQEESGYIVPLDKIHKCGTTLVSTQMSQLAHGYLVDVTGINKTEKAEYELDVSEAQNEKDANEFSGNRVDWLDADELMENNDWKSIWIFSKAIHSKFIDSGK